VTVKVADNGQLSLAPEVVLKRTLVKAGKAENVATIARKYRVNADQVAQWNKVGMSANFKPGQQVVLFLAPAPSKRSNSGTRSASRKVAPIRGAAKSRAPATRVAKR